MSIRIQGGPPVNLTTLQNVWKCVEVERGTEGDKTGFPTGLATAARNLGTGPGPVTPSCCHNLLVFEYVIFVFLLSSPLDAWFIRVALNVAA